MCRWKYKCIHTYIVVTWNTSDSFWCVVRTSPWYKYLRLIRTVGQPKVEERGKFNDFEYLCIILCMFTSSLGYSVDFFWVKVFFAFSLIHVIVIVSSSFFVFRVKRWHTTYTRHTQHDITLNLRRKTQPSQTTNWEASGFTYWI